MKKRHLAVYIAAPLLAIAFALAILLVAAHVTEAAGGHAPSRFHRVYPPETQHARDWLWRGLGDTQFACLDALWHYESGWRVKAGNPDGSYGIPQAYPGRKMASFGADWRTNPMTQVRWGLHYVRARYGSPCGAWAVWQQQGWY